MGTEGVQQDMSLHFNKQALVDMHERALDGVEAANRCDFQISGTYPSLMPSNLKAECQKELLACRISDLPPFLGRHAHGRILMGTLCSRPSLMMSLMTVMEDDHGDAVSIALYNVAGVNLPHWRQCFPKGMRI